MVYDAPMELENSPTQEAAQKPSSKAKKRKHTDSEPRASSKKRKHLDANLEDAPDTPTKSSKSKAKSPPRHSASQPPPSSPPAPTTLPDSDHDISLTDAPAAPNNHTTPPPLTSPFYTTTQSFYLPLPAIALSPTTALPSLLTTHLTPLLLTYYPPLHGIVLSISNPILSSNKPSPKHPPIDNPDARTVLAHCADVDGLSYIWLTATFLLFKPQIGDALEGWVNVCSEGFVGLVCYNYFQVAVARDRIPAQWRWVPPGGETDVKKEKGKMRRKKGGKKDAEEGATSQETLVNGNTAVEEGEDEERERESGFFRREDGTKVTGSVRFRVVDCEIVPGHDRESWSLQIEGTLLSVEEEERVLEEERQKESRRQGKSLMSGGLGSSGNRNGGSS